MTDEELINYDYKGVTKHAKMSMHDRAGQFSPFESLSGLKEICEKEINEFDNQIENESNKGKINIGF